jgi:hypothetical protein
MTFEKYINLLNTLYKNNPELKHITVVTSSDAEGNSFTEVGYEPVLGILEDDDFTTDKSKDEEYNAVCLN